MISKSPSPDDILQNPQNRVMAIGSKSVSRRPLTKWLVRGRNVLYSTVLVSAALIALEPSTGVITESLWQSQPTTAFSVRAEKLQWINLAPSPFLDAGLRPDGSFSSEQMLRAWRRAGLTPSQSEHIIGENMDVFDPQEKSSIGGNMSQKTNPIHLLF